MPTRLTLTDASLFPVQAFFNSIGDNSLVHVVDLLTREIGYASNETDCSFPDDLDPGEDTFDGVRFSLFDNCTILTLDQLRGYLRMICNNHIATHPQDRETLESLLARPVTDAGIIRQP